MILAGSKLEAAIAEGPEALQKFINSGEIEELQDVLPHDEEHDYLNDAYLDDDDEQNQNYQNCDDKSDSDMRHHDQDMRKMNQFRNSGDVDLRGASHHGQDIDFRSRDYDMRHMNTQMSDEEYRMPYNRDQDFRQYNDDEEMVEEEYEDDYNDGGGYQEPRPWHHNQFNQNRFNPLRNPNYNGYQNFRNPQQPRLDFRPPPPLEEHWGGSGGSSENFRGRGGWRGGPRGNPRGGRGGGVRPGGRGGIGLNPRGQNLRGGGGRGQSMRGRF